ncbi:AWPM-19-like family protein [Perilla frutescens var. hirtella]|nr:AWPM-19-like family protein [Perilla frutescens var. hirtella]
MASGAGKSAAFILLVLNVILYFIVIVIASWAVNHGIERSHETASVLSPPARIFPIYYPFGNLATGFVVIFSLIAGVVGFTTSITGIYNVLQWNAPNMHAAAASSLMSWLLTLLAMGLACKEIDISWTGSNLVFVEVEYEISMNCNACERRVVKAISKVKGVEKFTTDMMNNRVVITGRIDPEKVLKKLEKKTGKKVELVMENQDAENGGDEEMNSSVEVMGSWQDHYYGDGEAHMMFSDENANSCTIM